MHLLMRRDSKKRNGAFENDSISQCNSDSEIRIGAILY